MYIYIPYTVISAISIPSMLVIFAYFASANTAGSRELRGSRGGKIGCGVARLRVGSLGDSWLVTCGQVIAVTVIFNQFTLVAELVCSPR